ncbi:MAG: crotonase/enoyl-CoA hydratase family protein [bacterium]
MGKWDCLRLEAKDGVAHLVLNRPDKRNTMTLRFFAEVREVFQEIDGDAGLRVVVLAAEGKSFTAGLDLVEAATLWQEPSAGTRHKFRQMVLGLQDAFTAVEKCRKPVIAAIHSHCIGGGVDLVCACDIRLASRDAVFGIRETRMAMVADLGTLQRIASIVGQAWARELALTGRDFDASQALAIGFVTHVYPDRERLLEEAFKMAGEVARLSPITVQGVKETLNFSRDHGIAAGLEYVAQKNAALLPSDDLMEAFQAFMEKRPPEFKGR